MSGLHKLLRHQAQPRRQFLEKSFAFWGALGSTPAAACPQFVAPSSAALHPEPRLPKGPNPVASNETREGRLVFDAHLHYPSDASGQV